MIISALIHAPPELKEKAVAGILFYEGPAAEAMKHFQPLFDLQPFLNTTQEQSYPQLQRLVGTLFPPRRYYWKAGYFISTTAR